MEHGPSAGVPEDARCGVFRGESGSTTGGSLGRQHGQCLRKITMIAHTGAEDSKQYHTYKVQNPKQLPARVHVLHADYMTTTYNTFPRQISTEAVTAALQRYPKISPLFSFPSIYLTLELDFELMCTRRRCGCTAPAVFLCFLEVFPVSS